ncbi:unnamed protein product [Sphagnum balticum]
MNYSGLGGSTRRLHHFMKKVYAIGTMLIDLSEKSNKRINSKRLWFLYHDFDQAEKVVLENVGDIFEYYYNVALIEEIGVIDENDPPQPGQEHLWGRPRSWWYRAEYNSTGEDGIDLYCDPNHEVCAIEPGHVVHIENFTGPNASPSSPWWLETWSILVEGASGVLGYCELKPLSNIQVGDTVQEGEIIATITPVLKRDKGNGTTMLHFEQYVPGTKHHVTWALDTRKPHELLDPRDLLENIRLLK